MQRKKRNENGASRAPGFVAHFGMLAMGLGSALASAQRRQKPSATETSLLCEASASSRQNQGKQVDTALLM
jgi:hypothetical protein